jgi:hypothetical protein
LASVVADLAREDPQIELLGFCDLVIEAIEDAYRGQSVEHRKLLTAGPNGNMHPNHLRTTLSAVEPSAVDTEQLATLSRDDIILNPSGWIPGQLPPCAHALSSSVCSSQVTPSRSKKTTAGLARNNYPNQGIRADPATKSKIKLVSSIN